jgi:putative addiction module CopG family antidote
MILTQVELPEDVSLYVDRLVREGEFADANEVILHALRRFERQHEEKISALRVAIEEGEASGVFEGDAFASVRREMGWETGA